MSDAVPSVSEQRSRIMRAVPKSNTKPEVAVRKVLHRLGYRFRLHRRDLAGTPDIVLPRHRLAIFVHGCFWHRHEGCRGTTSPKTRVDFWQDKFTKNIARDAQVTALLAAAGWKVLVIWECETKDREAIARVVTSVLKGSSA